MGFRFRGRAGFVDKLDGDYGCGVPSRILSESDLEYIKREYCKDTADICECIFKGEKPSGIKMDCECGAERNWEVQEYLQGGYIDYDDNGNSIEMAEIVLSAWCSECGCDEVQIDSISVNNATYKESAQFHI